MAESAIINVKALDFPWETSDPFLFCVHHADHYPQGNGDMGPKASLEGRAIGQDFVIKDGWRMYHGDKVPGFPVHPHRGFETVTVVKTGLVDHADSMGAAGRYGGGDTQWMTAGQGIQHAEMFPLVHEDKDNPLELFQIWLNLPAKSKMVDPYFTMFWREHIPVVKHLDDQGRETKIDVIAGAVEEAQPLPPPPDSWAADGDHQVAIWTVAMAAGARWRLPAGETGLNRSLYFYQGEQVILDGVSVNSGHGIALQSDRSVTVVNGDQPAFFLFLQGRPINEPVVQYGPFVMNTKQEIQQAFADFRQTQFGPWPWGRRDPVHGDRGRFALHMNGKEEEPGGW